MMGTEITMPSTMEVSFWMLLGASIGLAAALRNGFSLAGGIIGGLLLGPLAFLMFFISGVSRGDERKRCLRCAGWMKAEASVCPHCERASLEVPVTVWISGGDEMQARTGNVSMGGLFVALAKPPPVGTMVEFALGLNGKAVRGFGEVVWIRLTLKDLERPVGMGLRFRHFLDDGEAVLRDLLTPHP